MPVRKPKLCLQTVTLNAECERAKRLVPVEAQALAFKMRMPAALSEAPLFFGRKPLGRGRPSVGRSRPELPPSECKHPAAATEADLAAAAAVRNIRAAALRQWESFLAIQRAAVHDCQAKL